MSMKNNKHRQSTRLRGYDYSQPGSYFITICVKDRECLFGEIHNGKIILNEIGKIAISSWNNLKSYFPKVNLDTFVVMPNHMHGIVELVADGNVGARLPRPYTPFLGNQGCQRIQKKTNTSLTYFLPFSNWYLTRKWYKY